MIKRIFTGLLSLVMVVGLLPATAFAAVTSTNDWDIFNADDTYNLPETQEQLLTAMIQNPKFADAWAPIVNNILPNKFVYNCRGVCSHEQDYTDFTSDTYKNVKYTERGMRNAIETIITESDILNGSNVLNSLPEGDSPFTMFLQELRVPMIRLALHAPATAMAIIFSFFMTLKSKGLRTNLPLRP